MSQPHRVSQNARRTRRILTLTASVGEAQKAEAIVCLGKYWELVHARDALLTKAGNLLQEIRAIEQRIEDLTQLKLEL